MISPEGCLMLYGQKKSCLVAAEKNELEWWKEGKKAICGSIFDVMTVAQGFERF